VTWSYSGDPSTSDIDAVRFEMGDTLIEDQQFQNEEIQHIINESGGIYSAAVRCCEILTLKYARQADVQLGPQKIYASQRSLAYKDLAARMRARLVGSNPPYAGGLSRGEKLSDQANTNLVRPVFSRELMDNRGEER